MKNVPAIVAALSLSALTFAFGYKLGAENEPPVPPSLVEQAQKASLFGAEPNWLRISLVRFPPIADISGPVLVSRLLGWTKGASACAYRTSKSG